MEVEKKIDIESITNSIKSKIGDEASGKIADDLASLLIYDKSQKDLLSENSSKIQKLQEDKDLLVQANANLLGKIPMGKAGDDEFEKMEEPEKPFDYRTIFQNGRFKR